MVSLPVDWEGVAVALLAVAVYINTLGHGFVYDDNRAILSNPDVQASSPLIQVFHNDFWGTPLSSSNTHGSYRPLCVLSFRLNYWTSGFQPYGYHLTNVLLHGVATFLVLKTARTILPGRSPALAAAVFAVHPVHVEAVAGVVGRADVLASIFYMTSFLFYVNHVKLRDSMALTKVPLTKEFIVRSKVMCKKGQVTKKYVEKYFTLKGYNFQLKHIRLIVRIPKKETVYFCMYLISAMCAALSKEPGITVVPLAVCYDAILHLRSKRRLKLNFFASTSASASIATFIIFMFFRFYIMELNTPHFSKADNPTAKEASLITRTLTFLYLPVFNFMLLIYPRYLSFDWSMNAIPQVSSIFEIRFALIVSFYYFLYRVASSALRSSKIQKTKGSSKPRNCRVCNHISSDEHLIACKMINNNNFPLQCSCLKPSNQILSTGSTVTMCLVFMVLPFLPASNLFFYVGFVVAERVLYIPSVGLCLLVALGAHALWSSKRCLVLVGCVLLLTTLGLRTLQRNIDWTSEEDLYRSAININPPKAYGNLGSILSSAGRLAAAEVALRKALEHRPNMADVHYNLGNLLSRQNKYVEAVSSYQHAIHYRPSLAVAHLNLGQVLGTLERWEEVEAIYRKCCQLDVTGLKDPKSHENARLSCFSQLNILCEARRCQPASLKVIEAMDKTKDSTLSEGTEQVKSSEIPPRMVESLSTDINLAKLVARNKSRASEAEELYLRAVQRTPTDPAVYVNYGQLLVGLGRHSEAAAAYLKAAQLAPQQHTVVTSAAIAMRHAGRLAEAEALYRQARELKPMDATSHSNLGAILHLQGKYQQAATCYKEALRLSPNDEVTIANLQKLRNLLSRNKR